MTTARHPPPVISTDGRWWWDGSRWRSLLSPDGRWWWNGQGWVPALGSTPSRPLAPAGARSGWRARRRRLAADRLAWLSLAWRRSLSSVGDGLAWLSLAWRRSLLSVEECLAWLRARAVGGV